MAKEKPTLEVDGNRNPDGTFKEGNNANPTGQGGFQERPEDINKGGRLQNQERYGFWLDFFKNLPLAEFKKYQNEHPEMPMAALGAYARVAKSVDKLDEFKEVANRTEGMPKQNVRVEGEIKTALVEFIGGDDGNTEGEDQILK